MRNPRAGIPDFRNLHTNRGSEVEIVYAPALDKQGRSFPREVGTRNVLEEVNSHAMECDITQIIARLNAGDTSVLARTDYSDFGDTTLFPKTPAEALQLVLDGQKTFDSLPADVRGRFGNDFNRWFCTAGSADWLSAMAPENVNPTVETPVSPKVEKEVIAE